MSHNIPGRKDRVFCSLHYSFLVPLPRLYRIPHSNLVRKKLKKRSKHQILHNLGDLLNWRFVIIYLTMYQRRYCTKNGSTKCANFNSRIHMETHETMILKFVTFWCTVLCYWSTVHFSRCLFPRHFVFRTTGHISYCQNWFLASGKRWNLVCKNRKS